MKTIIMASSEGEARNKLFTHLKIDKIDSFALDEFNQSMDILENFKDILKKYDS